MHSVLVCISRHLLLQCRLYHLVPLQHWVLWHEFILCWVRVYSVQFFLVAPFCFPVELWVNKRKSEHPECGVYVEYGIFDQVCWYYVQCDAAVRYCSFFWSCFPVLYVYRVRRRFGIHKQRQSHNQFNCPSSNVYIEQVTITGENSNFGNIDYPTQYITVDFIGLKIQLNLLLFIIIVNDWSHETVKYSVYVCMVLLAHILQKSYIAKSCLLWLAEGERIVWRIGENII